MLVDRSLARNRAEDHETASDDLRRAQETALWSDADWTLAVKSGKQRTSFVYCQ